MAVSDSFSSSRIAGPEGILLYEIVALDRIESSGIRVPDRISPFRIAIPNGILPPEIVVPGRMWSFRLTIHDLISSSRITVHRPPRSRSLIESRSPRSRCLIQSPELHYLIEFRPPRIPDIESANQIIRYWKLPCVLCRASPEAAVWLDQFHLFNRFTFHWPMSEGFVWVMHVPYVGSRAYVTCTSPRAHLHVSNT